MASLKHMKLRVVLDCSVEDMLGVALGTHKFVNDADSQDDTLTIRANLIAPEALGLN